MNQSLRSGNTDLNIYDEGDEDGDAGLNVSRYDGSVSPRIYFSIGCDMTVRLALQIGPDQVRAAKNLGTAAGVTMFDSYDAEGRIGGGNAFWFNSYVSTEYSNLRFNLSTGELSSSASATGTFSPISLALPTSANGSINGVYGESFSRGDSFFNYKEAKTICLGYRNEAFDKGFELSATAYGNMFYATGGRRSMVELSGLEGPRGIRIEGCGGGEG